MYFVRIALDLIYSAIFVFSKQQISIKAHIFLLYMKDFQMFQVHFQVLLLLLFYASKFIPDPLQHVC